MPPSRTRDPRELAEAVRRTLVPQQLRRRQLDALEPLVVEPGVRSDASRMARRRHARARTRGRNCTSRNVANDYVTRVPRDRAAVVCTAPLRAALAEFFRRFGQHVEVYAYGELPPELELRPAMILEAPERAPEVAARA